MQLEGRVALITGGDSGIGLATAQKMVSQGARVAALGLTQEKVDQAVRQLRDRGGEAIPQVADLVVFLASDAASHITGTPVWIDGGESLLQG